ncbi:hypothetical protein K466DRAFT_583210 [Polyporus arcularius HHB13444]|uniref:Uncharacterized protein n=1 Tax=Polyporus arcularius HHB13444 TaxID=1314778 RepID=A0A5C3PMN5_9APHY|nr:hypothetical protein K466DRAFT_583210 [Polyporus arcularius HHB13444]
MSSSSSERPTRASAVSVASGEAAEETPFTPKLVVVVVGCLVGFFIILFGFWVVSRRTCCARNRSRLPQYNHIPAAARRGAPTADLDRSRCRLCPFSGLKARDSESMIRAPIPSPPPPYTRALSTPPFTTTGSGSPPPLSRLSSCGSSAARTEFSGPSAPDFPPPAYIARGPRAPVASISRGRR